MVTTVTVTVTVRQTHIFILCKLYTYYAKVIYFWSINHILITIVKWPRRIGTVTVTVVTM